MAVFHVMVVDGGRIVIPEAVRRKHGIEDGATLVIEDGERGVSIRTLDEMIADVQAIMAKYAEPGRSLSDELIADRRAEAARA